MLPRFDRHGRLIALAGCICLLAGCGGQKLFCSLVGCGSGIEVLFGDVTKGFPAARDVRVCANTVCTTYPAGPVGRRCGPETVTGKYVCEYVRTARPEKSVRRLVSITLHSGWLEHTRMMPLTITVLGADAHTLFSASTTVRLRKTAPNGVKCGPVCYNGAVMFDPRGKQFVEFAGHQSLAHTLSGEERLSDRTGAAEG
jgi:hypothetical protein